MTELKPCPFCGSKKIRIWTCNETISDSAWCQCESCLVSTSEEDTDEEAIEAWNRRAIDERNSN